ncbi:MAG: plastocyanin/azurin family copper-binding protein [Acidimicrobiales bacterium]
MPPVIASRSRSRVLVALALLASLALTGCADKSAAKSGGDTPAAPTVSIPAGELVDKTGQATVEINAIDNELNPRYVEISTGTRVIWRNGGRNKHDIVPGVDGAFKGVTQANFAPGGTYSVTFGTAGDFPYFCSVHGTMKHGMNAVIRVVAAK